MGALENDATPGTASPEGRRRVDVELALNQCHAKWQNHEDSGQGERRYRTRAGKHVASRSPYPSPQQAHFGTEDHLDVIEQHRIQVILLGSQVN